MRRLLPALLFLVTQPLSALPEQCMGGPDPLCLLEAADEQRRRLEAVPVEYAVMQAELLGRLADKAAEAGKLERAFALLLRISGIEPSEHDHMLVRLAMRSLELGESELFDDIGWELSSDKARIDLTQSALRVLTSRSSSHGLTQDALSTLFSRAEHRLRRHLDGNELREWLRRLARGYQLSGEAGEAERLLTELDLGDDGPGPLERGDFTAMMEEREWSEHPSKRAKQRLKALERWAERWPERGSTSLPLIEAGAGGLSHTYIDLGLRIHEARRLAGSDPVSARQRMGGIVDSLRGMPDSPERDYWLYTLVDGLMDMDKGAWDEAARWSTAINDRMVRLEAAGKVMDGASKQDGVEMLPTIAAYFDDPVIPLLAEYEQAERLRKDDRDAEAAEYYRRAMRSGMALKDDLEIDGRSLKSLLMMEVMERGRKVGDPQLAHEAGRWLEAHIPADDEMMVEITMNLAQEYRRIGAEGDAQRLMLGLRGRLSDLDEKQRRFVIDRLFEEALDAKNWAEAESLIHQGTSEERRPYMNMQLADRQLEQGDEAQRAAAVALLQRIAEAHEKDRDRIVGLIRKKGGREGIERLLSSYWLSDGQRESLNDELMDHYVDAADQKGVRRLLAMMEDREAIERLLPMLNATLDSRPQFAKALWEELLKRIRADDWESMSLLTQAMEQGTTLWARHGDEYSRLLEQTPAGVRLRLQTLSLRGGPNARRTAEEWNEAWRDLLRRGESLALGERLLLWLAVAQVQLAER